MTALIFSEHVHNGVVLGWFGAVPFGHGLDFSLSRIIRNKKSRVTSIRILELFQFSWR